MTTLGLESTVDKVVIRFLQVGLLIVFLNDRQTIFVSRFDRLEKRSFRFRKKMIVLKTNNDRF